MKNIILLFLILISITSFSQKSADYIKFVEQIKKEAKIDNNDKTVYKLLDDFYDQALQSDKGELNPDISQRIEKLYADTKAKNMHLLTLFLTYQNHISETAAAGKQADPNFQINLITDLESELKTTFGNVPLIVIIYKAEALQANNQSKESAELISKSLVKYPSSIPLKVYNYENTKDVKIKQDLIKNHSTHWMVQQFEIK